MAYATSELYKEAIKKDSKITFVDGELITKSGTTIQISNEAIDQGTFYITNQCVNSDAFMFGAVFAAEAGITLKTDIDRYSLYDAELSVFFNILLSDNTYEKIPLGKFYVNEPNRVGKSVVVKAYDNMISLDGEVTESLTGTAYDLLVYISVKCGVELAQTEAEILQFVNTEILLSVGVERVDTYRDLLSYIAQVTCTFAIFDRAGKLKLCPFGTEVIKTISAKERTSSKFSDFETHFSSMEADLIADTEYKTYSHVSEGSGSHYIAGELPIVQGTDETNQAVIDNMFIGLENVKYTPCDISFKGDPSLDLGDMIKNVDRFGNEITSLITFYKWSYRGGHQIKSAGQNPKISNIKDKSKKQLASLQSAIASKDMVVYTYTNGRVISIQGGDSDNINSLVEVAKISIATNKDSTCVGMLTIPFEMSNDGEVEFHQFINGERAKGNEITQYCSKGKNTVTFMNYFDVKGGTVYRYSVSALSRYIQSDIRVQAAKVQTNENARDATILAYKNIVEALKTESTLPITSLEDDVSYDEAEISTAVPTVTISPYSLKAIVFGQGLVGTIPWDGTITISEEIIPNSFKVEVPVIKVTSLSDSVSSSSTPLNNSSISDAIPRTFEVHVPVISVSGVVEAVSIEHDVT